MSIIERFLPFMRKKVMHHIIERVFNFTDHTIIRRSDDRQLLIYWPARCMIVKYSTYHVYHELDRLFSIQMTAEGKRIEVFHELKENDVLVVPDRHIAELFYDEFPYCKILFPASLPSVHDRTISHDILECC